MRLADFEYELPDELIARYPLEKRSASRLLCLDKKTGDIQHRHFSDLLNLIEPNDLLVCNNSAVIAARLLGHKSSGGQIEVLIERVLDEHRVLAHVRASKSPKPHTILQFAEDVQFEMVQRHGDLFELRCLDPRSIYEVIDAIGLVPIPPYFNRMPDENDKTRYQTVYAKHKGSVAAPTAGLHFDAELIEQLTQKGVQLAFVTLHIGAGTFAPVRVDDVTQHKMHAEMIDVSLSVCEQIKATKARGGRIIAVGTTAARCLESASSTGELQPFCGETSIFIYPGYIFRCVDALITNLHLPGSTLLMLVAALAGHESIMQAYKIAVAERYRFFSYGDAMFIG